MYFLLITIYSVLVGARSAGLFSDFSSVHWFWTCGGAGNSQFVLFWYLEAAVTQSGTVLAELMFGMDRFFVNEDAPFVVSAVRVSFRLYANFKFPCFQMFWVEGTDMFALVVRG